MKERRRQIADSVKGTFLSWQCPGYSTQVIPQSISLILKEALPEIQTIMSRSSDSIQ